MDRMRFTNPTSRATSARGSATSKTTTFSTRVPPPSRMRATSTGVSGKSLTPTLVRNRTTVTAVDTTATVSIRGRTTIDSGSTAIR